MARTYTYCVYVVDLDPSVWTKKRRMRKANPHYDPATGKGCLYVGLTSSTPEERRRDHANGILASAVVRDYGGDLRYDLSDGVRTTQVEAEIAERELEESLREQGYAVWPVKPGGALTIATG